MSFVEYFDWYYVDGVLKKSSKFQLLYSEQIHVFNSKRNVFNVIFKYISNKHNLALFADMTDLITDVHN